MHALLTALGLGFLLRYAIVTEAVAVFNTVKNLAMVHARLGKYVRSLLKVDAIVEGVNFVYEEIKDWLSQQMGILLDDLNPETIKSGGGEIAAKAFNAAMVKNGLPNPAITTFYVTTKEQQQALLLDLGTWLAVVAGQKIIEAGLPDPKISSFYYQDSAEYQTLVNEFGAWGAEVANTKIKQVTTITEDIFSNLADADAVKYDIDAFVSDAVQTKTGLVIPSIFEPDALIQSLQSQVITQAKTAFSNQMTVLYLQAVQNFEARTPPVFFTPEYQQVVAIMRSEAQTYVQNLAGLDFANKNFSKRGRKAIANRERMRKYRQTHKEQRVWIPI